MGKELTIFEYSRTIFEYYLFTEKSDRRVSTFSEQISPAGDYLMPSKWRVKRIFSPMVNILARCLGKRGVTPNGATWTMLVTAILSAIVLNLTGIEWVFGLLVFFTGVMDGVDGSIARQFQKVTKTGEFFDSFSDRISEIVISLGCLFYFMGQKVVIGVSIESWIAYMIMGSIMVSYVRARAVLIVKGDYDKGLFARSERLFTLFVFSMLSLFQLPMLQWGIVVVAIGANITAFYRVYMYRKMLKISGPIAGSSEPLPPEKKS